jgi:hypothetical protein
LPTNDPLPLSIVAKVLTFPLLLLLPPAIVVVVVSSSSSVHFCFQFL